MHKWCTKIDVLTGVAQRQCGKKRKILEGGHRKLTNIDLKREIMEWNHLHKANVLHVSRKLIMQKAKAIHDESND